MKKFIFLLFIFLFSSLSLTASGVIDSQDGFLYLAVARNIYYKGQPTAPIYEYDKRANLHMNTYIGKDGNTYSPTGLGYSLALVPAVALTDIIYKFYNVSPSNHFPLENDWLILLFASFTNCIFGAMLGVTLFQYFKEIKLNTKQALIMVFISIFTTNLWVYTKHSFAHMMYITFFTISLLLLRKYSQNNKKLFLLLSGLSYGISVLTYNQTFILTTLPMIVYYIFLIKQFNTFSIKQSIKDCLFFLIGFSPFIAIFVIFEITRTPYTGRAGDYAFYVQNRLFHPLISVTIEGLWGQLFSPGRSFFIYSPITLIIIFFWHKIRTMVKPELITLITLSIIFVGFYSIQYTQGRPEQGYAALWHGEFSWGPRYLLTLIPFSLIITANIYQRLSRKSKLFVFYPLAIFGLYVELLGIIMPYQIKLHDLQDRFFINSTEYPAFTYSNLLPRYTPIYLMSKQLVKLAQNFPKTLDFGLYNVHLYDGIDFPFNVGKERWRVIDGKGYISFDNLATNPIKNMTFAFINHPLEETSSSALIKFTLNNKTLLSKPALLKITERRLIDIPINSSYLKEKGNQLTIEVTFVNNPPVNQINFTIPDNRSLSLLKENSQILGMIAFSINGKAVNIESLDIPYVSQLGPASNNITYLNYGGINKDPWKIWNNHTQIYERVPDFWWIKPLYYWDLPKQDFIILLIINITAILYSGSILIYYVKNKVIN